MGERDSKPANTLRERVGSRRQRIYLQVLLNTNRYLVTTGLAFILFILLIAISQLGSLPLRTAMQTGSPVIPVFQAMIIVTATVVALAITIGQIVLAEELGPLSDQHESMRGAMDFLANAENQADSTTPPEPGQFLGALIELTIDDAKTLNETIEDSTNDELRKRTLQFTDSLISNATTVSENLETAEFGQFDVIQAALDYNYAWKIYRVRRLYNDYEDDLSDDQHNAFIALENTLTLFGPAREHIKTMYFRWQLVDLSRQISYLGVISFAIAPGVALFIDPGSFPGATLGIGNITWIIIGAFTIANLPILLLVAYTFRLATVTKRTLAIGPFVLRQSERTEEIDIRD